MKVILLQTIDRLGKAGEVISVKEGYARNYLIPKNVAREATSGNMKMLDVLKKKQADIEAKNLAEVKALAEKIAAISLTIPTQAGEEDKLFGSVSNDAIAEALVAEGITVDKRDIILDEPIKKLGVFQVTVKLHSDVKANLKVWIVKK
ncbi:MAG: 50S ribosomal protein L9 [Candidatus Omnitrophica bacterium]|nr:50S ribosomal protein L9 [Candidatus Omnitrophota bacterium]MDD5436969.1 50S ribosomal protein L9 [Candidatus Omnitrophota bacterium]